MSIKHKLKSILLEIFIKSVPDEFGVKYRFRKKFGYNLDLSNLKTFNEKIQWLKLFDHNNLYTILADKYLVREYVKDKIGEQYLTKLYNVWDSANLIDFDQLPEQFVLKTNHASGTNIICSNKNALGEIDLVVKKLNKWLKIDYHLLGKEWAYKNIKRKIICEELLTMPNGEDLVDYKFMCFNGKCEYIFICSNRYSENGLNVDFYDTKWEKQPFQRHYPNSNIVHKRPNCLDKMIELANKLSESIPFVRVDFYLIENRIVFGEMTLYPGSGFEEFTPFEWDEKIGCLLNIENASLNNGK